MNTRVNRSGEGTASAITAEIVSHDTPGFMENDYKLRYSSPQGSEALFIRLPTSSRAAEDLLEDARLLAERFFTLSKADQSNFFAAVSDSVVIANRKTLSRLNRVASTASDHDFLSYIYLSHLFPKIQFSELEKLVSYSWFEPNAINGELYSAIERIISRTITKSELRFSLELIDLFINGSDRETINERAQVATTYERTLTDEVRNRLIEDSEVRSLILELHFRFYPENNKNWARTFTRSQLASLSNFNESGLHKLPTALQRELTLYAANNPFSAPDFGELPQELQQLIGLNSSIKNALICAFLSCGSISDAKAISDSFRDWKFLEPKGILIKRGSPFRRGGSPEQVYKHALTLSETWLIRMLARKQGIHVALQSYRELGNSKLTVDAMVRYVLRATDMPVSWFVAMELGE